MSAAAAAPLTLTGTPEKRIPRALADLAVGESAQVLAVEEPGELGDRLMELGLTPGVRVRLIRRGLFGDPLQIQVRGSMLSLRRRLAQGVRIAAE